MLAVACSPLPSRGGEQVNDSPTTRKDVTPRMAGKLTPLSPGELSTTSTACDWLVNGKRAMAVYLADVRGIVERVCSRPDVLDACRNRDLGTVTAVLCANGLTQGRISGLTGIPQGRLSEYKTGKRKALASTIEAFAGGLGQLPPPGHRSFGMKGQEMAR
jgi:hypothetical protein